LINVITALPFHTYKPNIRWLLRFVLSKLLGDRYVCGFYYAEFAAFP